MGGPFNGVHAGVYNGVVRENHLATRAGTAENLVLPRAGCRRSVKIEGVVVDMPVAPRLGAEFL